VAAPPLVTVPYAAAAVVLAAAGIAKLGRPGDTAGALRVAGLPARPALVRAGAAVELVVGVAAWVAPGPVPGAVAAAAVAASYLGFAVFVAVALRCRWPLATCGCFARPDTPPRPVHVLLDAAAAAAALAWAAAGRGALGEVLAGAGSALAPLAATAAVLAALAYLVFVQPVVPPSG
jgi:hypothetical protein